MFSLPPINTEPTLKRKIGIQDPNLLPSVLEYHWPPRNKCINLGLLPANQYSHEEKKKICTAQVFSEITQKGNHL